MSINTYINFKKILIALACILAIVCTVLGIIFLLLFIDLYDFEKALHRLRPVSVATIICFYGILPSLIAIIVMELKKCKKARTYMVSSVLCLMILLVSLYTWKEIIDPFLESRKPVAHNNFGFISSSSHASIPIKHFLLMIGLSGSFINIIYSWLYWFFAVRGGRLPVKNWKKTTFRIALLISLTGALFFYIFPTYFIAGG